VGERELIGARPTTPKRPKGSWEKTEVYQEHWLVGKPAGERGVARSDQDGVRGYSGRGTGMSEN